MDASTKKQAENKQKARTAPPRWLSVILIGRQTSERGNVAGKMGREQKPRRQSQYLIPTPEEGLVVYILIVLGHRAMSFRKLLSDAPSLYVPPRPKQITGRSHYFSIMHMCLCAWREQQRRTVLANASGHSWSSSGSSNGGSSGS